MTLRGAEDLGRTLERIKHEAQLAAMRSSVKRKKPREPSEREAEAVLGATSRQGVAAAFVDEQAAEGDCSDLCSGNGGGGIELRDMQGTQGGGGGAVAAVAGASPRARAYEGHEWHDHPRLGGEGRPGGY
jgi:hypothetical protein